MFKPKYNPEECIYEEQLLTASSTTITEGACLKFTSWYVEEDTATTTRPDFIAAEGKVTASGEHEYIRVYRVDSTHLWEWDCTGTPTQAEMGTLMTKTDAETIDEDDTTNGFMLATWFNAADKKVRFRFIYV